MRPPSSRPVTRAIVFALAFVGVLAGCSSASSNSSATTTSSPAATVTTAAPSPTVPATPGTGSSAAYRRAMAKGIANADPKSSALQITTDQAACLAPKWVAAIGLTALHRGGPPASYEQSSYDYTALGLTAGQATKMVAAFDTCGIDLYHQFLDVIGQNMSGADRTCAARNLSSADVHAILTSSLDHPAGPPVSPQISRLGTICHLNTGN